jgi:hypothetical protein
MQICPKCGYQRKRSDGSPDWQCPACGIAYCKVTEEHLQQKAHFHTRKKTSWHIPFALLLIAVSILITGYYQKTHQPKPHALPLGISPPNSAAASLAKDPIQIIVEGKVPAFEDNGYLLTPLASFEIEAKVLSRENYWFGRTADLSPTDLVLGWGLMATDEMLEKVSITQSNRWFFWRVAENFTPELGREISNHASNMHIIPANAVLEKALSSVKTGQVVYIKGYLIEANASDGWNWRSSLSREDTGDGACELVWADELRVR